MNIIKFITSHKCVECLERGSKYLIIDDDKNEIIVISDMFRKSKNKLILKNDKPKQLLTSKLPIVLPDINVGEIIMFTENNVLNRMVFVSEDQSLQISTVYASNTGLNINEERFKINISNLPKPDYVSGYDGSLYYVKHHIRLVPPKVTDFDVEKYRIPDIFISQSTDIYIDPKYGTFRLSVPIEHNDHVIRLMSNLVNSGGIIWLE